MKNFLYGLILLCWGCSSMSNSAQISGELKQSHKITLSFQGPETSERDENNPFLNYRLDVTFEQGEKSYVVPGYYAADGKSEYTSAEAGSIWRVHFAPPTEGTWQYRASFKKGEKVAVASTSEVTSFESAGFFDGSEGTLEVAASDKVGRDMRAHGHLDYVGEHYLRHKNTGKYFVKVGADAPENLLAYDDFDVTSNYKGLRKNYQPHARDYSPAYKEFCWGENQEKGKNLLGAITYLASKKMNAFSFLTFNIDGDDRNVFPHLLKVDLQAYEDSVKNPKYRRAWKELVEKTRFDVSKMAQWEKVFEFGTQQGMFLHFKTTETENDDRMDRGNCGTERKIYYRELIARFGHHPALNWNIGEENTQTAEQVTATANYIASVDPYRSLRVLHTFPTQSERYAPFLGKENVLTGLSCQLKKADFSDVHERVVRWVKASKEAGMKWVVAVDEPGDAKHALITDEEDPGHTTARENALWGTLMGGGCGVEWYFGYQHPHSDLTCQDWRSREEMWDQSHYAAKLFEALPLNQMSPCDELVKEGDYCFGLKNKLYLAYFKSASENPTLELPTKSSVYQGKWYNPRTGEFSAASFEVKGGEEVQLTKPTPTEDWALLLQR